jgi:hypothetical protein
MHSQFVNDAENVSVRLFFFVPFAAFMVKKKKVK